MEPTNTYNEKLLLEQVTAGDELAFRQLFHHYRAKLFTYLYNLQKSREEAEDALHDVFLKIWERRAHLPTINNFESYLFRVARNQAYFAFQQRSKEILLVAALKKETATTTVIDEDRAASAEIRRFIQSTVDKLTPQQRQVFLLSRQEGLPLKEVADRMGLALRTVKNHITAALRLLRDEIDNRYGPLAIAIFVLYGL